jgi:CO/xanthine dehydrogenase Mo-binding subunit
MNRVAERIGMDPVELRRRNAYEVGDVTPTGQVLRESVGALETLERALERSGYATKRKSLARANAAAERAERAGRFPPGGRRLRRGIGLSLVHHGGGFTGSGEQYLASVAAVDLTRDGRPRVLAASTEIGQGEITVFAQMVAETLGVPAEMVVVHTPDTAAVPNSGPTVASRTTMMVGGILVRCAQGMREELEKFAGRPLDGPGDFQRQARRLLARRGALKVERRYEHPPEIRWSDDTYRGDAYPVFGYDCCVVEVEVDLDTGETRALHVTTAVDLGKAIHPVLAAGQIEGGTAQALGWALLEEVRLKDGRVWNQQLTNYIIPTAMDAPPMDVILVEDPYSRGPFGAKGVGELPFDAPAAAAVAAIEHATGVRLAEIPVLPEKLLRALAARGRGKETR